MSEREQQLAKALLDAGIPIPDAPPAPEPKPKPTASFKDWQEARTPEAKAEILRILEDPSNDPELVKTASGRFKSTAVGEKQKVRS